MENKVKEPTKKVKFGMVRELIEGSNAENTEMLLAFIDREVELLTKKSSTGTRALTATQKANIEIKAGLLEELQKIAEPITVTNFIKAAGLELTTSKVSALFKQMIEEGTVEKVSLGKLSLFKVV